MKLIEYKIISYQNIEAHIDINKKIDNTYSYISIYLCIYTCQYTHKHTSTINQTNKLKLSYFQFLSHKNPNLTDQYHSYTALQ